MRVVCLYFEKPQDLKSIAEIFYSLTPQIVLRDNSAIFLEISKCKTLYSEKYFIHRATATLKKLNIDARISIANDIPTALSFAVYNTVDEVEIPIEALDFYFNPLLKEDPSPALYKMIQTLQSLGIKTLNQFKNLSPKEISNRFGTLGIMSYLKAKGDYPIAWEEFVPSQVVEEKFYFDEESPADNLEPIYFRLRPLLDKITLRLRAQSKRIKQFEIIFKQEYSFGNEDPHYRVPILLQLPHLTNKIIFQITKERVDHMISIKPFQHRISEVSILVTETAPYSMKQKDIFDQKREENDESFYSFVSRVATKLGKKSVFFADLKESYSPEKSWQRSFDLPKTEVADHLPERPLRLLPHPIPVRFLDNKILYSKYCEEVLDRSNKEIILADWWDSPLERMYYKLFTSNGKKLWIYKSSHGHFLHGIFD